MAEWWASLTLLQQISACIALPATLLLVLQTVLLLFGFGDSDSDTDLPDEAPDGNLADGVFGEGEVHEYPNDVSDTGLQLFTVRGITAFFAVFGWCAVALGDSMAPAASLSISVIAGLVMMLLVALAMWWFSKLQSDGTADIRNALGASGRVYIRIPSSRSGTGKVNITLQGSYSEISAVTDEENDILFGEEITVVGISGDDTLVVKRK